MDLINIEELESRITPFSMIYSEHSGAGFLENSTSGFLDHEITVDGIGFVEVPTFA